METQFYKCTTSPDVQALLEKITISNDTNTLLKLYSNLTSCLITYPFLRENVVKCYVLYEKACSILNLSQPLKLATVLTFFIALVYNDDDQNLSTKQSATQYARNMIRVSGCLRIIVQHFISNSMMPVDTWKVVCQCIVECCRGCDTNQSCSSHLIPMCIDKCKSGDLLTLSVLQALLQGNERNCEVFVESKGLDLFTQKSILYERSCVQLLATLVQEDRRAAELIQNTSVPQHLVALIQAQGPFTQIGQWCKVVLYYIYGNLEVLDGATESRKDNLEDTMMRIPWEKEFTTEFKNFEADKDLDITSTFINNVLNECHIWKKEYDPIINTQQASHNNPPNINNVEPVRSSYFSRSTIEKSFGGNQFVNDKYFQQNAMKHSSQNNIGNTKKENDYNMPFLQNNLVDHKKLFLQNDSVKALHKNTCTEKRQSLNNFFVQPKVSAETQTGHFILRNQNSMQLEFTQQSDKVCQTSLNISTPNCTLICPKPDTYNETHSDAEFQPMLTSTPKSKVKKQTKVKKAFTSRINKSSHIEKSYNENSCVRNIKVDRLRNKRIQKHYQQSSLKKVAQNKTMSARIFSVLNETCSTVVNTLKDIILPKKKATKKVVATLPKNEDLSCSFSFTNYMKRRDAALRIVEKEKNNDRVVDIESKRQHSCSNNISIDIDNTNICKTCNDTVLLKRKLDNDVHLRESVRKLKIGINLYGCNFKKISKTMWRNEAYMTPEVLYSLYRKLILK